MIAIWLLAFILASLIMARSSAALVNSLVKLGRYFKATDFLISFVIMATATSLPELFLSIISAIEGTPQLALGTVIGSNIADLTLVIGITSLVSGNLRVESILKKRNVFYMAAISILMILLLLDGLLSRADGLILLLLFGYYAIRLFSQKGYFSKKTDSVSYAEAIKSGLYFTAGLVFLLLSSGLMVRSAESIALEFRVPIVLIGLLIVALGTSLPELALGLAAAKKDRDDMIMGNILGSVVVNSALILGLTALIHPITVQSTYLVNTSLIALLLILGLFVYFLRTDKELSLREGVLLIFVYIIYVSIEYLSQIL